VRPENATRLAFVKVITVKIGSPVTIRQTRLSVLIWRAWFGSSDYANAVPEFKGVRWKGVLGKLWLDVAANLLGDSRAAPGWDYAAWFRRPAKRNRNLETETLPELRGSFGGMTSAMGRTEFSLGTIDKFGLFVVYLTDEYREGEPP